MLFNETWKKPLFILAVILGYSYILLWPVHPYPLSYLLKASPLLIMTLLMLNVRPANLGIMSGFLFVAAMLMSALGDVFLDFDRVLYLKQALGSFLFAQIAYIVLFWPRRQVDKRNIWFVPLLLIACGLMLSQFYPNAGALWWPVVVYVIFLAWMALAALWTRAWPVMLGGTLFLCADALIGVNRFWIPFEHSTPVIVTLYISGQLLLSYGVLFGYLKGDVKGDEQQLPKQAGIG